MPDPADTLATVILKMIGELGYRIDVTYHGGHVVIATSPAGETWTVRGPDYCAAVCELAEQVGIELEDG